MYAWGLPTSTTLSATPRKSWVLNSFVATAGNPRDQSVAFEIGSGRELEAAAAELDNAGHRVRAGTRLECEQRQVDSLIMFEDPSGNAIELVALPSHSGLRYVPPRDAV